MIRLRSALSTSNVDVIVLSALDEIAWLFNLRGEDIPNSPIFISYAIVSLDRAILYIPPEKQSNAVKVHLNSLVSMWLCSVFHDAVEAILSQILCCMKKAWGVRHKSYANEGPLMRVTSFFLPPYNWNFDPQPLSICGNFNHFKRKDSTCIILRVNASTLIRCDTWSRIGASSATSMQRGSVTWQQLFQVYPAFDVTRAQKKALSWCFWSDRGIFKVILRWFLFFLF